MKKNNEIKNYKENNMLDLEKIINEYNGYVNQIIKNMTIKEFSKEDVEEIIADTFFILWKNKDKLEEDKKLSSYLAGIVRNLVREKARGIKVNYDISDYENTIADLQNIDMLYEQREKTTMVEKMVKQMKLEEIEIFKLYYYSSKKIKEISSILNISEFAVKSKLYRIRKKIKKELEKGGYSNESE